VEITGAFFFGGDVDYAMLVKIYRKAPAKREPYKKRAA